MVQEWCGHSRSCSGHSCLSRSYFVRFLLHFVHALRRATSKREPKEMVRGRHPHVDPVTIDSALSATTIMSSNFLRVLARLLFFIKVLDPRRILRVFLRMCGYITRRESGRASRDPKPPAPNVRNRVSDNTCHSPHTVYSALPVPLPQPQGSNARDAGISSNLTSESFALPGPSESIPSAPAARHAHFLCILPTERSFYRLKPLVKV